MTNSEPKAGDVREHGGKRYVRKANPSAVRTDCEQCDFRPGTMDVCSGCFVPDADVPADFVPRPHMVPVPGFWKEITDG